MIEIVQDTNKFKWAGVPFEKRYSQSVSAPKGLLKRMQQIDELLDLKFYMPTEKWHVVRYPNGRSGGFTKVWECHDNPELGLRGELGEWIIEALIAGDTRRKPLDERLKEIDDHNKQVEEAAARELEANSKDTAKDLCKVLTNWHDYGPDSDTHLNYKSAEIPCTSTK